MDEADIRKDLNHTIFLAYGTARIFDKRMRALDWKRKTVTFLGVLVPLMIGGSALSFGLSAAFLPILITIAGILTLIQLAFSLWSLVAGWDRSYSDCIASVKENTSIYNQAEKIVKKIGHIDKSLLESLYEELKEKYERREQGDLSLVVNDKELRFANRMACFHYKKECHICKKVPAALKAGNCDGCGNY
ncbi:mobilome CxxCx(11)CxxC protein [Pantoea ananatis]|uniref:mobilome CxxCx(11)CxxC protein n=1 Tax=Pantoea ananas TaxID=553 RepID=UPI003CF56C89